MKAEPTVHHHGNEAAELTAEIAAVLSQPERRVEGRLKVTGRARYTADLNPPGTLVAAFLTAGLPHARIVSIEAEAARAVPGVHAVLTAADLGEGEVLLGRRLQDWPVLARERVRFIGDRVAAVAAETHEAAEAALQLIQVEYEELPAIFNPIEALAPDAPALHPRAESYTFFGKRDARDHPNLQGSMHIRKGDDEIDAVFARCARVFEHTFTTPRQHQGFIEPRACLVSLEGQGDDAIVRVLSTNKAPFSLRQQLSAAIGVPQARIVVENPFIGGDFGGKGLSIDEYACYYLAKATGRPVKSVMRYADELQWSNPRHSATIRLKTGVDAEGRFLAHQSEVVFDGGAYAGGKPGLALVPMGGPATLAAYRVPNTRLDIRCAYTNTVPGGHMRAPGEVQALFAGESHVDMIARELGMDPLQFRRLNALRPGDVGIANDRFHETRAVELLDVLARETAWGKAPLPPNVGRGIAMGVRHVGGGKTGVALTLRKDGTVEVLTAVPDPGSGSYTLVQRVVAATLSIPLEHVEVRHGNTANAPQDPGSGGSRVTHVVGEASRRGAVVLKERLLELAAEVMGWPAEAVRLEGGLFIAGDHRVAFREVAERIAQGAPVEVAGEYDAQHGDNEPGDNNFCAFMVEAEADPETGQVRVRDVLMVADVGTILNPTAHQGQLEGGFVYGFGNTMLEELTIEEGKVGTVSLADYKLPTQSDVPPLRTVLVPTLIGPGPFGAKMAGEVSNSGIGPALANAVYDAIGARVTHVPITAERVLAALG